MAATWQTTDERTGGELRKMALGYFGLGDGARDQINRSIADSYGFLGDPCCSAAVFRRCGNAATEG
jgi:hypothetical protein